MASRDQAEKKDYLFASEPTMIYSLGFTLEGDVHAGEIVFVSERTNKVYRKVLSHESFNPCMFEYVYFARPDARLDDISVYRARLRLGQNLAKQWQQTHGDDLPDVVIPAPFTANTAALSFAQTLNVRYSEGLYKNPFIGRTFIMANTAQRNRSVRHKLTPQPTEIKDKKVMIIDDSIVRGTTSREIVQMVRDVGAKAVYFGSTCPPIKSPCFYGIDMPTRKELIAYNKDEESIREFLGVDKLIYQNVDGLTEAITRVGHHGISTPCMACLNGCYVTGNITEAKMVELEQKR
jgi:amidophosphoribosyltransferase